MSRAIRVPRQPAVGFLRCHLVKFAVEALLALEHGCMFWQDSTQNYDSHSWQHEVTPGALGEDGRPFAGTSTEHPTVDDH